MRSRQIFGTHQVFQETFLQIHKLLRQLRISQELNSSKWNPWRETTEEPIHKIYCREKWRTKARLRSEMPVRTVSQKFSSLQWRRLFKEYQQRLQISDLHFDKFPTPATFLCWKIRFKTEVCTCSQFPTEAMQWIKEVELADSVDELKSSLSIRSISNA